MSAVSTPRRKDGMYVLIKSDRYSRFSHLHLRCIAPVTKLTNQLNTHAKMVSMRECVCNENGAMPHSRRRQCQQGKVCLGHATRAMQHKTLPRCECRQNGTTQQTLFVSALVSALYLLKFTQVSSLAHTPSLSALSNAVAISRTCLRYTIFRGIGKESATLR